MSALESVTSSVVANAVVPLATAALSAPPLPPELGLAGLIADEQASAASASAWKQVGPVFAGTLLFVVAAGVAFAFVRRPARRGAA